MGGCIEGCFLHCMKGTLNCCICDCCYGKYRTGFCTHHETSDGKTVFNDAFALILYDKWSKESTVYEHREQIFHDIYRYGITDQNVVRNFNILDVGCGTGTFSEVLGETFMKHHDDTLICLDVSPQCLHWVRTRVVEDPFGVLHDKHVEYFLNEANTLCLETNYDENDIDVVLMAFTMRHISVKTGDRYSMIKELYKVCKEGGIFIVIENGPGFMNQFVNSDALEETTDKEQDDAGLLENAQNPTVDDSLKSCESLQQYVETFGFIFVAKIMEDTFGNNQWILLFRK
eukprot:126296_1